MVYGYCLLWLGIFVLGGLYLISKIDFYFTDIIFIVVCSWAFPIKTASYCLDRLENQKHQGKSQTSQKKETPLLIFKFIISPLTIYKDFIQNHDPLLPIHSSYLLIKAGVSSICLLVNYILLTQIISPYLDPAVYNTMSFP